MYPTPSENNTSLLMALKTNTNTLMAFLTQCSHSNNDSMHDTYL